MGASCRLAQFLNIADMLAPATWLVLSAGTDRSEAQFWNMKEHTVTLPISNSGTVRSDLHASNMFDSEVTNPVS